MEIYQIILIALLSYLAAECVPWCIGDFGGFYVLSRPLVSGMIVGFILNDVKTGVTIGAAVQTVYLASLSVGGAIQTDLAIVAYPAVALGIVAGGDANIAIAIATTLGTIGVVIWNAMEFINVFWGNLAAKEADKGNANGVIRYHVWGTQLTTFILRFGFSFLILYFGADFVTQFANTAPAWILNGLSVIGGILSAIGISMITSILIKENYYWIYLLIGFLLVTYFNLSMIAVAIIGVIVAIIAYRVMAQSNKSKSSTTEKDDMEANL